MFQVIRNDNKFFLKIKEKFLESVFDKDLNGFIFENYSLPGILNFEYKDIKD